MRISLDEQSFITLAHRYPVVPVSVEILADYLTPVGVYSRLVGENDGILLESVEGGERWARWSFVGWDPAFTVRSHSGITTCSDASVTIPSGNPLEVIEALIAQFSVPDDDDLGFAGPVPPLHSGAVGYLGYDMVRYIESLDGMPHDDRKLPEMLWQFVGGLAAFDRLRDTLTLIVNVFVGDNPRQDYADAVAKLEQAIESLSEVEPASIMERPSFTDVAESRANLTRGEFEEIVECAISLIKAGDAFQIVPSIRFETDFDGEAFDVYRALRLVNPSPFMFHIRSGDLAVVGSSPELMSRVDNGRAYSRPIAGTRPRGSTLDEDRDFEADMRSDPKELAEHTMLIDLARNDLGRVCKFGSVVVDDLMVTERYSHVMHMVSGLSGDLREGVGPIDVLRATFPHGTVTGAPKIRAMEIIDELEPTARGPYAGAVGYIDFSGNLDTAIALRTCVIHGTTAWVQAGAGVVVDSSPSAEYDECVDKAKAVLYAIAAAGEFGRR